MYTLREGYVLLGDKKLGLRSVFRGYDAQDFTDVSENFALRQKS
jgi:hypothetical protein